MRKTVLGLRQAHRLWTVIPALRAAEGRQGFFVFAAAPPSALRRLHPHRFQHHGTSPRRLLAPPFASSTLGATTTGGTADVLPLMRRLGCHGTSPRRLLASPFVSSTLGATTTGVTVDVLSLTRHLGRHRAGRSCMVTDLPSREIRRASGCCCNIITLGQPRARLSRTSASQEQPRTQFSELNMPTIVSDTSDSLRRRHTDHSNSFSLASQRVASLHDWQRIRFASVVCRTSICGGCHTDSSEHQDRNQLSHSIMSCICVIRCIGC